jgi:hypothetical protein
MGKKNYLKINKTVTPRKFNKLYLFVVPVVIFGAIAVFHAVESATQGAKLIALEEKVSKLNKENKDISDKLIQETSLSETQDKVEELGYTKPAQIIYITPEKDVASASR